MALKKDHENAEGNVGNYWRITAVSFDIANEETVIVASLYKDSVSRNSGKQVMDYKHFVYKGADSPFAIEAVQNQSPYVTAYEKLKTEDFFQGALDA